MAESVSSFEIGGTCDARFAGLPDAMRENLAHRGELGASVAVYLEGRLVVDLWCGHADAARRRPWRGDTLVNAFSVGKAFAALSILMLADRAELAVDDPIARHWPEFAAGDKQSITIRQLLAHRAGLPAIRTTLPDDAIYAWHPVTEALATETPWWTPGTAHGYHVHTFGFLTGELVRRVSGLGPAAFLRRHVAEPLHADVSYGLAASERHRCAPYLFAPEARPATATTGAAPVDPFLRERAYLNPPGATGYGTVNTPRWQDAELPSANLHATARGVARVYQALLQGKLVSQTTLDEATREASNGPDRVLGRASRFGLGFQLTQPERPLGPNANAFGHFGAGGSLGFADPDAGLAFGYVMNRGGPQWRDPRNRALIDAVYGA